MATVPDDLVLLVVTHPSLDEDFFPPEELSLSVSDVHDWDLTCRLRPRVLRVRATRSRLVHKSTFFRALLQGSFRESGLVETSLEYDTELAIPLLQFMYGCSIDITLPNFLTFFETSFWYTVNPGCTNMHQEDGNILCQYLRRTSLLFGILPWIVGYRSSAFVTFAAFTLPEILWAQVISSRHFKETPYALLCSCIEHPQLTVTSEKQLSEALVTWITSVKKPSAYLDDEGRSCILKKIRVSLLPLAYAAEKRKNKTLSGIANESVSAIFDLMKDYTRLLSFDMNGNDADNPCIRLTQYSQVIDLHCHPQLTMPLLLLAVLPQNMHSELLNIRRLQALKDIEQRRGNYNNIYQDFCMLSFNAVNHVDLSKCPNIRLNAAIKFLGEAFPSLTVLKFSHCVNFKFEQLYYLLEKCPLIEEVDFTADVTPVLPSLVSILSSNSEVYEVDNGLPHVAQRNISLFSNITKLTLEGQTGIHDLDLSSLTSPNSSLSLSHINIKGCTALSDVGISKLIYASRGIESMIASHTSFGRESVSAFCFTISSFFSGWSCFSTTDSTTAAARLRELQIDGCKRIDRTCMEKLTSQFEILEILSLRGAHLLDDALFKFNGSLLEALDVSDTMVSVAPLAYIIERNPGLKSLKMNGCTNLHPSATANLKLVGDVKCQNLAVKLGEKCFLENLAFGWGFCLGSLEELEPAIKKVKAITVGTGASLSHQALSALTRACPLLESVVLTFQVISDSILRGILESSRHLEILSLCCCIGDLTSWSFQISTPSLKTLKLERVTPWMTNDDLVILTQNSLSLVELSLSGCTLLSSDAQQIIAYGWPGLTYLHLEDCGSVMSNGMSSIYECIALEDLLLRHVGRGIRKNFIADAASRLPLLRKVALDLCDACEGGFNTPSHADRYFVSTVKIACCKSQKCAFNLGRLDTFKPVHKQTMVLEWNGKEARTTIVKERV